eukprot:gb/GFBE01054940.1/.p1 GENE.gb/GFBE01054940.1/~~gb/GFBE01054940.1/.p1  ORF type:complete len:536 (+),score=86.87 gb/GFBE01054940.1/:1-1608(+)
MGAAGGRSPANKKRPTKKSKASGAAVKRRRAASTAEPKQVVSGHRLGGVQTCEQRSLEVAAEAISGTAQDFSLWGPILVDESVADFVRQSLLSAISWDPVLARSVAAQANAWSSAQAHAHLSALTDQAREIIRERGMLMPVTPPDPRPRQRRRLLGKQSPVQIVPAPVTPQFVLMQPLLRRRKRLSGKQSNETAEVSAPVTPPFPSSLQLLPMTPPGSAEPPPKRRKLLSGKQSNEAAQPQTVEVLALKPLPQDLVIEVMTYLDVRSKVVEVQRVSSGFRQALQERAAWDPLVFDQATCRPFLRKLKQHDPLGCFTKDVNRTKAFFPKGFFDVLNLHLALMDPDKLEPVQSDTEDESPKPRPVVIPDPLDEVCKRLRLYFKKVVALTVTNIEDYRMDYRFVTLRSGSLEGFGFVQVQYRDTIPPTYDLVAWRDVGPRLVDPKAMERENRSRVPDSVPFNSDTRISEREALYLAEHLSAYKNGDDFHLGHALYRTVRSHTVRKRYKALVSSLRQRFPDQFPPLTSPLPPEGQSPGP